MEVNYIFNGFENEDEYIRSLKKDESYNFSYTYEYIVNKFGNGDDDVELANASVDITVYWDDSSVPGYLVTYIVNAPTPIPNAYTTNQEGIYEEIRDMYLYNDLYSKGLSAETFKFW